MLGAVVEEFAREGEVAGSNPDRRKVCKNHEKNAATVVWGVWLPVGTSSD